MGPRYDTTVHLSGYADAELLIVSFNSISTFYRFEIFLEILIVCILVENAGSLETDAHEMMQTCP